MNRGEYKYLNGCLKYLLVQKIKESSTAALFTELPG